MLLWVQVVLILLLLAHSELRIGSSWSLLLGWIYESLLHKLLVVSLFDELVKSRVLPVLSVAIIGLFRLLRWWFFKLRVDFFRLGFVLERFYFHFFTIYHNNTGPFFCWKWQFHRHRLIRCVSFVNYDLGLNGYFGECLMSIINDNWNRLSSYFGLGFSKVLIE